MEAHLAAHRGHAERIAVAADARHHAGHEMPRLGVLGIAEGERVEAGDRPRAHGEHVAQDAADPRGRALVGLDVARVVVALHLEDHRQPVTDVDHARVLARALDHPGRLGRQAAQMDLRRLVGAVLVPHRREDAELGEARRPADEVEDALIFVGLEAVLGDEIRRDWGFVAAHRPYLVQPPRHFTRLGAFCARPSTSILGSAYFLAVPAESRGDFSRGPPVRRS